MLKRYRVHLLIGLLAFACSQGWNRWNIDAMLHAQWAKYNVRDGHTLTATDDASYLSVVDHMLGDRPDLDQEPDRPDLRAPGYRIWYLMPRLVLGTPAALSVLTALQCLLYAFVVMLLWEVFLVHGIPTWARWLLILLFAIMPTFHGFLFHTITEGVTPALSLIVLCSALLAGRSRRWLWIGVITWSLLMVTRPALMWVGLALLPALWQQQRSVARIAAIVLLAFAPTALWWGNNMMKAGRYVGLHEVYRVDEPGINRPVHGAFWDLAKSWGARGEAFHPVMEYAFRAALEGDLREQYADAFVQLAPTGSLTSDEENGVRDAFARWQRFNHEQLAPALASAQRTIAFTTREEQAIIFSLQGITDQWRSEHPFHHHVRVPFGVLKGMVMHSNLNLFLFQGHLRGIPLMELLRWISAFLHAGLLLCVLLAVLIRTPAPVRWCALGACSYIGYLAYVQRGVEERYTLPVLFIAVACAAFVVQRFRKANFVPRPQPPPPRRVGTSRDQRI